MIFTVLAKWCCTSACNGSPPNCNRLWKMWVLPITHKANNTDSNFGFLELKDTVARSLVEPTSEIVCSSGFKTSWLIVSTMCKTHSPLMTWAIAWGLLVTAVQLVAAEEVHLVMSWISKSSLVWWLCQCQWCDVLLAIDSWRCSWNNARLQNITSSFL